MGALCPRLQLQTAEEINIEHYSSRRRSLKMALPGTLLVRLRGLYNLGKYCNSNTRGCQIKSNLCVVRWNHRTRPEASVRESASGIQRGSPELLKQFPEPKNLLHTVLSRSLGSSDLSHLVQYSCTDHGDVKRATVTVLWPSRIEMEGFASRRVDAERFAAAAVCLKLKELGVIGPDNQLLANGKRAASRGRGRPPRSTFFHDEEEDPRVDAERHPSPPGDTGEVSEALSLFPHPKPLLATVVQVATASSSLKNLIQYKTTTRGKLRRCDLTLRWPETMTFTATARKNTPAERAAAALACMKLKDLGLIGEDNKPLTHARYHQEAVRESAERERQPYPLEIPQYLEERVRGYLAQYPVEDEIQRMQDAFEEQQQSLTGEEEEEEESSVMDAITGRPYRPLSAHQARQLSEDLRERWERAMDHRRTPETELPVDSHRQRVVEAVQRSRVVVVHGDTGCGKTTRIPRFLLEEHALAGHGADCNILVTQPRRISAVSVAHRVSHEMGPELRRSVGYQVRLDSRLPEQSGGALLFLTVGVLLRKLQGNASLRGVSHVVVDEVHERDVNTDLLLALLRAALEQNPALRVVLMSATGDDARLAAYFGGCPVVRVPGFMHPVRERYLEDVLREMGRRAPPPTPRMSDTDGPEGKEDLAPDLDLVADVIDHIDRHGEPGAVLCFLPGWQDIKAVQERLESKHRFASGSQLILPLHSSMSVSDQQVVFQRPPVGQRKIVLATNIAETSITIDDIVHVVDVGTQKEQNYDPRTKVSCLDTVWVSRSNVTQRRGRAGRCQPGHSYHLFPRQQLETMATFPIPEILRTPLESVVMQAKIHSPNCKAVDFLSQVLDSPEPVATRNAVRNLQDIGVLDAGESLTPLGQRVACISCDPQLGKVLVLSAMFRCVLPLLSVAACLTKDPFYNSMQNRALVTKSKQALGGSSHSDYVVFSRAVLGWRKLQQDGDRTDRQEYLEEHTLSPSSLRFINGLISQFSDNLNEAHLVSRSSECQQSSALCNQHSTQEELLKAVLFAGLFPKLIKVKKGLVVKGRFRSDNLGFRIRTGPVLLHRSSVNRNQPLPSPWLTFYSAVQSSGNVWIRDSSAVHPLALLLLTDCDVTETVRGDQVQVSLSGSPMVNLELSLPSWELLWDLRSSIQTMLHRNLSDPAAMRPHAAQDGKLISLLVEMLNNSSSSSSSDMCDSDSEVD